MFLIDARLPVRRVFFQFFGSGIACIFEQIVSVRVKEPSKNKFGYIKAYFNILKKGQDLTSS